MKQYSADRIRNVGLFAHGGAGKTSLAEALLFDTKATTRLGRVDEGNTVTDYDPDEIKRSFSVSAALAPVEWRDTKINIIDAPGYADFIGDVKSALRVSDAAIILIDASAGVEVGTEKMSAVSTSPAQTTSISCEPPSWTAKLRSKMPGLSQVTSTVR